ncbi:MAG: WYL domain-containing protein, partial [Deltaproteobacteria bacterium]|nr:WYL domain-containing protein [Deltaproteobacteria bacterium]
RTWHPSQNFQTLPDGRLLLRLRVAITVELATWVLGFGPDAEVIKPDDLVVRIGGLLREAARRYPEHVG